MFEDGTLLMFENHLYPGAIPGHRRAQRSLVRVAPTGQLIDTVLVIPDAEYVQDGTGLNAVLFGLRSGWHVGEGDRVYVATGEEFRLDVYDTGGVLLRSLRRDYDRPAVRPEHIGAERERRLAQAQTDEARRRVEETLRELRIADLLPASGQRILVDADANVWLKHYEPPGASSREWSVFGPDGGYLGGVQVPPNFQIMDIRNDRVLGVWIDELDVPAVRIYELERSSG